jgi:hypothetical protein
MHHPKNHSSFRLGTTLTSTNILPNPSPHNLSGFQYFIYVLRLPASLVYPKPIQIRASLPTKDHPTNTVNNSISNLNKLTTKNHIKSLRNLINLPNLNPKNLLTLNPLLATSVDRKDIRPVSAKSTQNSMNSKLMKMSSTIYKTFTLQPQTLTLILLKSLRKNSK